MKVLKKCNNSFSGFTWLNFDNLPKSEGYKFEVYIPEPDDIVSDLILNFYILYRPYLDEILISEYRPDGKWGDFCIDTWDIENEANDYSPDNKHEPTASYLAMLRDNNIEPEYTGFCKCLNWDKFLYVTLHCIIKHAALYSMMFYVPNQQFVFYFHHTGSFGIYYKELNEEVKNILYKIREENLEIKNASDKRIMY